MDRRFKGTGVFEFRPVFSVVRVICRASGHRSGPRSCPSIRVSAFFYCAVYYISLLGADESSEGTRPATLITF